MYIIRQLDLAACFGSYVNTQAYTIPRPKTKSSIWFFIIVKQSSKFNIEKSCQKKN